MSRAYGLLAFMLFMGTCFPVLAAEPFAEASVGAKGPIVTGQQISVDVDVYVPNFFTSPPQFPVFELENAIVTLPDARSQNLSKTVNGEQFSGIRRTYLVIPQRAGDYALPPASIPLGYAAVPGQSTAAFVNLPPTKFSVVAIPGQGDGAATLAATNVEITQSLDRDPASLKVGETLVRTVTLFAQGTQAMMLPQPRFDVPAGVKLYAQAPKLEDAITGPDGKSGSRRIDRVTYMMEQEGKITLPALAIDWFNTDSAQTQMAQLVPLVLTVKAPPPVANSIPPERLDTAQRSGGGVSRQMLFFAGTILLVLVVLGELLHRLLPSLLRWIKARRELALQSEPARYRQLSLALGSGNAKDVYRALDTWTRSMGFRTISDWAAASDDKTLIDAVNAFEKNVFGSAQAGGHSSMRVLTSAILAWRVRYSARVRQTAATKEPALPPLNPYP